MAILGMLFGLGAGALAFIMYMGLTNIDFKSLGLLCLLAAVVSFILIIICVILFAVKLKDSSWNFGYSFGLSITGAIVLLLGGGAAYGATH
ncbi:hypothetical protein RRG08_048351 [Elysia crispata]|uniref:Uncharacterized protein n=1 Tax=Elysia crispata TaxID=231223 RepID=A0AAE1CZ38_9GAST|nr:hypothetical protein RRG08_048351 [Elysia crispata]